MHAESVSATQKPDWSELYEAASQQEGYFTSQQAQAAGYSLPLLSKHQRAGRVVHVRRGIHRLVHFPPGEHDNLIIAWLWSEREGVASHQTALSLHELSDVLPAVLHLSVPASWRRRRLRVPPGILLHHADVAEDDRTWVGAAPVTTVKRTLEDCAIAGVSPELLQHAASDAIRRGLVRQAELPSLARALSKFGGLHA